MASKAIDGERSPWSAGPKSSNLELATCRQRGLAEGLGVDIRAAVANVDELVALEDERGSRSFQGLFGGAGLQVWGPSPGGKGSNSREIALKGDSIEIPIRRLMNTIDDSRTVFRIMGKWSSRHCALIYYEEFSEY